MDYEKLLKSCRAGDEQAWSKLVKGCERLVYGIPVRLGLGPEDVSDVFMATFQALYQNLDRIEHASTIPRWLAVTASREALRLLRNRSSKPVDSVDLDTILVAEDQDAEANAIAAMQATEIHEGLELMDERCRTLLKLLYCDDEANYAQISGQLNMPVGAIGPTRARCLEKLRKILNTRGFTP